MYSLSSRKKRRMYSPKLSDLPTDLSANIANRLTSISDYVAFRGVCKSWRTAATFANFDSEYPQVPWLVFTKIGDAENLDVKNAKVLNFLDVSKDKKFRVLMFNQKEGKRYFSSKGWLLCVARKNVDVNLTHPFWPIWIELPDLDTFPGFIKGETQSEQFIKNVALTYSPTVKSDLVVMVIWGSNNQLGFSRPGDSSWTVMESWGNSFTDMVYHNGKLYALDSTWRVVEIDIHGQNPTQIKEVISLPQFVQFDDGNPIKGYLVESSGKFLIVSRECMMFRIFEIDLIDQSHNEIIDIGNKTLFLDSESAFCIDHSVLNEVKPNCIYLSGRGVYSLAEDEIIVDSFFDEETRNIVNPLMWVLPIF